MKKNSLHKNQLVDMPVFPSFRYVEPLTRNKKVLDLGCGVGRYLEKFSQASVGIDQSVANINQCRKRGLTVLKANLNKKLPLQKEEFEVVFASHIIEHLDSPLNFLKESNRVLEEKGIIILGLPIEKSLARILGDHYFKDHPDHLYGFSIETMKSLLHLAGFSLEEVYLDLNLVGRLPFLNFLLDLVNRLPLCLVIWWSNAVWIVARKNDKIQAC